MLLFLYSVVKKGLSLGRSLEGRCCLGLRCCIEGVGWEGMSAIVKISAVQVLKISTKESYM